MRLLKDPSFNFMDNRRTAFMISGALILFSLISLVLHGGPKYGIDFRGGTLIEYRFMDQADSNAVIEVPIQKVRDVFAGLNLGQSEIKYFGSTQDIFVKIDNAIEEDDQQRSILNTVSEAFPEYHVVQRRTETVGPKVGKELVWSAVAAILASMVLILIYIMFRFELRFGVGAVMALFHDVTITLGLFSILDIEITIPVIAALLTIIGYSLNDTIVVFDRIRENLKTLKRKLGAYAGLVNRSINETLSRTIVTSLTTLMVVIILYFFGGEIIKDFAFALIFGVIIGTYSSIYIASPILVEWEERQIQKQAVPTKK